MAVFLAFRAVIAVGAFVAFGAGPIAITDTAGTAGAVTAGTMAVAFTMLITFLPIITIGTSVAIVADPVVISASYAFAIAAFAIITIAIGAVAITAVFPIKVLGTLVAAGAGKTDIAFRRGIAVCTLPTAGADAVAVTAFTGLAGTVLTAIGAFVAFRAVVIIFTLVAAGTRPTLVAGVVYIVDAAAVLAALHVVTIIFAEAQGAAKAAFTVKPADTFVFLVAGFTILAGTSCLFVIAVPAGRQQGYGAQ